MKRFVLASALFLSLIGCTVNQTFVKGVDAGTSVILPRYIEYVINDPELDEETKVERLRTVESLRRLINEAKDE